MGMERHLRDTEDTIHSQQSGVSRIGHVLHVMFNLLPMVSSDSVSQIPLFEIQFLSSRIDQLTQR